jgi:S-layer protein (TIGR01567 family)
MLLVVAFPVSAAVQASTVEMRGTTGIQSWDAQNFAGFFYDLKNNISTEQLYIDTTIPGADLSTLNISRSIPEKALIYSTNPKPLQFKMNEQQNVTVDSASTYDVVGWQAEKWIAVNNVGNKLAKLVFEMEKDDKKTLTTGETWSLGAGYELTINAIYARATPRQVLFTLKKDGAVIDEGIGQPPASGSTADKQKAVYYKTKTILNESDSLLFTVYVVSIFSGATSDMVQFKYAWLIDESSAKEIQGSDDYGVFEVTQANTNGITMDNKNTVNLSKNSETTLMGNLKFKIADNDTLRFYPMVTYTDPGTYEVRGTVADASVPTSNTTYASWNAQSFTGFFYDLKNNISTESLDLLVPLGSLQLTRTIPEKQLLYSTGKAAQQFKANDTEGVNVAGNPTYSVVGWQAEKWIAVNDITNKIAKLTFEMDKEDKKTLRTGETWSLGSGYELTINAIYARATPRQVLFTLKKDGGLWDKISFYFTLCQALG